MIHALKDVLFEVYSNKILSNESIVGDNGNLRRKSIFRKRCYR